MTPAPAPAPRRGPPPAVLMVLATLLFALMAVCVKFASAHHGPGEIVFYRSIVGVAAVALLAHRSGGSLRTTVPMMHVKRGLSGVLALSLWFYAIGGLPLATAMTLNYMSSVWMALFLIGGAIVTGRARVDLRLVAIVLAGFGGVLLILRPTIAQDQLWHGLVGLCSGVLSAAAYLQVAALGRSGEPEYRIVFYFSLGGLVAGGLTMLAAGVHPVRGISVLWLLAVGLSATAAQLLMTRAYATGKPLVNASLQYLAIVFASLFGALLFDDPVTWSAAAGMMLIIGAGVAAAVLRGRNAPTLSTPPPAAPPRDP